MCKNHFNTIPAEDKEGIHVPAMRELLIKKRTYGLIKLIYSKCNFNAIILSTH